MPPVDPFLYTVTAIPLKRHSPKQVEAAIDAELRRMIDEPVTPGELAKELSE